MADESNATRRRLETKAIVLGYAMSRLDKAYLQKTECGSWRSAFQAAARALDLPAATFKNLRDEFDPVHPNSRKGWHKRALRGSRQRVLDELHDLSDDGLAELVVRILQRDDEPVLEAIDSLAVTTGVAYNVAERLLTGRRAEEYFLEHCQRLVGVKPGDLVDMRNAACGYDFGVTSRPERAIEVKGMKRLGGSIQFTDREWTEAATRRSDYWVVIVGGLSARPRGKVVTDPRANLEAKCRFQKTVCAVWQARVAVVGQSSRGL